MKNSNNKKNNTALSSKDQAVNSRNCTSNTPNLLNLPKLLTERPRNYLALLNRPFKKLIQSKKGTKDSVAIELLSYVIDQYTPRMIKDDLTGEIKLVPKFQGSMWQTQYKHLADELDVSKSCIQRKLAKLEKLGLVQRCLGMRIINKTRYNNVLYIRLNTQLIDGILAANGKGITRNIKGETLQVVKLPYVQDAQTNNYNLINNTTIAKKQELRFSQLLEDNLITQISDHLNHSENEVTEVIKDLALRYPDKIFSNIENICKYLAQAIASKFKIPKDFSFYLKNLTNHHITTINFILKSNYSYEQVAETIQDLIAEGNNSKFKLTSQFLDYLIQTLRTRKKDKTFLDFLNTKACKELNLNEAKLRYLMKKRPKPRFRDGDEQGFKNYILTLSKSFFKEVTPLPIYRIMEVTERTVEKFNRTTHYKLPFDDIWLLLISQMKQGLIFYEVKPFLEYLNKLLINKRSSIRRLNRDAEAIRKTLTIEDTANYYYATMSKRELVKEKQKLTIETTYWANRNDDQVKTMYQYYCSLLSPKQLENEETQYKIKDNKPLTRGFLKFIRHHWNSSKIITQEQTNSHLLPRMTNSQANQIQKYCSSFQHNVHDDYFFKNHISYKLNQGTYNYGNHL